MRHFVAIYFALMFYIIGALTIENDVNYNTWRYINHVDFKGFHKHLEILLSRYMFIPIGVVLIVNVALIFAKSLRTNRWLLIVSAVLLSFIVFFSLVVQVPIHKELEMNFNEKHLKQLIDNHNSLRFPATFVLALLNVLLLARLLRTTKV